LPLEVDNSHDVTFANFHSYRVVSMFQPFLSAVQLTNSQNIHFRNMHIYSDSKAEFDNGVVVSGSTTPMRQKEVAALDVTGMEPRMAPAPKVPVFASSPVVRLATGFYNISGAAIDPKGQLYFVDYQRQHIFRWNALKHQSEVVSSNPLWATNLFFDKAGNLMMTSYEGNGTVLSMDPNNPDAGVKTLSPQPARPLPGKTAVIPADYWRFVNDRGETPARKPWQFVSPDGTTFLAAGDDFINGTLYYGTKMHDVIRAFGLVRVPAGSTTYFTDEDEHRTWQARVDEAGSLHNLKLFAQRGGEPLAWDRAGNVYIGDGQIYVYRPDGSQAGIITVPEHPTQILFGGPDRKTLFILARTNLYSTQIR